MWHVFHREAQITEHCDWRTSGVPEREGASTKRTKTTNCMFVTLYQLCIFAFSGSSELNRLA